MLLRFSSNFTHYLALLHVPFVSQCYRAPKVGAWCLRLGGGRLCTGSSSTLACAWVLAHVSVVLHEQLGVDREC